MIISTHKLRLLAAVSAMASAQNGYVKAPRSTSLPPLSSQPSGVARAKRAKAKRRNKRLHG